MLEMLRTTDDPIHEKIWITIESSFPFEVIRELLDFDCVIGIRFNLSKEKDMDRLCGTIGNITAYRPEIRIMLDFGGTKQRIQLSKDKMNVLAGQTIVFVPDVLRDHGNDENRSVYVSREFTDYAVHNSKPGDVIYISDGWQQFRIDQICDRNITCSALTTDTVYDNRGISVKGLYDALEQNYEDDTVKLEYLCRRLCEIDCIVLSFCNDCRQINAVRKRIRNFFKGKIYAKIETVRGVANCSELARNSDGIMLGRGDLLVELSYENRDMMEAEKRVAECCRSADTDFIVATRVADSLETNDHMLPAETIILNHEITNLKLTNFLLSNETTFSCGTAVENLRKIINVIKFINIINKNEI